MDPYLDLTEAPCSPTSPAGSPADGSTDSPSPGGSKAPSPGGSDASGDFACLKGF